MNDYSGGYYYEQEDFIMKFTLLGFSQQSLVNLGLDIIDAMILRYFIDFKATNKMKMEQVDGCTYFWIRYDAVLKELPILNIKKCTVQARFFKLRDAGVLTHYVKKLGGTYSFFGIGDKYKELLSDGQTINETNEETAAVSIPVKASEEKEEELQRVDSCLEAVDSNPCHNSLNAHRSSLNAQGYQFKLTTNNPSTKYPSIKYTITSPSKKALCKNLMENPPLLFQLLLFHFWNTS